MKLKTLLVGESAYLYLDLLVALAIISITVSALFSASTTLKMSRARVISIYHQTLVDYEKQITESVD